MVPSMLIAKASITIVIPAFNAASTLAATVQSALAETAFTTTEIAIIDDGSTDQTLAVARGFEPGVRVLTGPNLGVSAARNRGIAETTADWLLFLDADDILLPGTLKARLAEATAGTADVIVCDWQDMLDDGSGTITPGAPHSLDWAAMRRDAELAAATTQWATTAAILYRRSMVQRIGGFRQDLPVIQDARFLFDAAHYGARIAHAPHFGAHYRVLGQSLSRRNPCRFWQDVLLNGKQIEAAWRTRGTLNDERQAALAGIYNTAARGLFAAGHPSYFEAVAVLRALGGQQPRHGRVAAPLAKMVGLKAARDLLAAVGRR